MRWTDGSRRVTDDGMTRLRPAAARPAAAPAPLPHSTGSEAYRGQANHYDQRTDAFRLWRELLVARLPVGRGDTRPGRRLRPACACRCCRTKSAPPDRHRDRRVRADARPGRRADSRARLGQRPTDRRPGRARPDRHRRGRRGVLRGARRHAMPGRAQQCPRPSASRRAGGRGRRQTAGPMDVGLAVLGRRPARPYISGFTGFDKPWARLAQLVPDLRVRELAFGAGYLAVGHTPGR
jgi:hypothetical protein